MRAHLVLLCSTLLTEFLLPARLAVAGSASRSVSPTDAVASPYLLEALNHSDWSLRWDAANRLGYLKDPQAIGPLVKRIVEDGNNHVRWRACWAVKMTDPSGAKALPLLRARLEEENPILRWRAVIGLTLYGGTDLLPFLREGLDSPDLWIRWEAIDALGRLRSEESVPWLETIIMSPNDPARLEASAALTLIDGPEALKVLKAMLGNTDPRVRSRAIIGFVRRADPFTLPVLEKRLEQESDAIIAEELRRGIRSILDQTGATH